MRSFFFFTVFKPVSRRTSSSSDSSISSSAENRICKTTQQSWYAGFLTGLLPFPIMCFTGKNVSPFSEVMHPSFSGAEWHKPYRKCFLYSTNKCLSMDFVFFFSIQEDSNRKSNIPVLGMFSATQCTHLVGNSQTHLLAYIINYINKQIIKNYLYFCHNVLPRREYQFSPKRNSFRKVAP